MVNTSDIPQMTRQKTDLDSPPKKVAFLTAGGLAPCLSASVGGLITEYASKHPSTEIICYVNGYQGLLLGNSILVTPGIRATAQALLLHGGSPIGTSRAPAACRRRRHVPLPAAARPGLDGRHSLWPTESGRLSAVVSRSLGLRWPRRTPMPQTQA